MVNHVGLHTTFLHTQSDHVAEELLRQQHVTLGDRLAQLLNIIQRRQLGRAVDVDNFFGGGLHFVHYRRRGSDQVEIVFTLQTLLNDLHVQQAEEAAAEAEAQRGRTFRLVEQRGVVEAQFAQRVAESFIIIGAHREQAGIHLRFHLLKARQRFVCRVAGGGQGIAHRRAEDVFDRADQPANLAAFQLGTVNLFRGKDAQTVGVIDLAGAHDLDLIALAHGAVFNPHQRHHAEVVIEPGVDNQRLQRRVRIAFRRRNIAHQTLQHVGHADAGFRRAAHRIMGIDPDDIFNLVRYALRVGRRQVDLVEYRNDLQVHLHGGVAVGQGLGFYALPGVNHQQRAFARGEGTGDFIGEVHVARGVDKVQLIGLTVVGLIVQGDALRLDSDPAFALKIHGVQNLGFHFTIRKATANLDDTVRQRRLTVVDVSDDRKVTYILHI